MPDPITDDGNNDDPGQTNPLSENWYDSFAGDDPDRREALGKFESFDDFFADYNSAKNADWRDPIAGDDEKFKAQLKRYADPASFGNAHREAVQKIRSGQLKEELPADATEEQIKEYRRANNIPLEPTGYLDNLPEGLVLGDKDKDLMLDFASKLHEKNLPPEAAHAAVEWYNKFEEEQQAAIAELDNQQMQETDDLLHKEWGADYRTNRNLVETMLNTHFGEEAATQMMNGRYGDGRGFFNDPNVLKGWANMARMVNDVAPIVAQDADAMKSLQDEKKEIESKMGTAEYRKDEAMQARYRELLEIELKANKANKANAA